MEVFADRTVSCYMKSRGSHRSPDRSRGYSLRPFPWLRRMFSGRGACSAVDKLPLRGQHFDRLFDAWFSGACEAEGARAFVAVPSAVSLPPNPAGMTPFTVPCNPLKPPRSTASRMGKYGRSCRTQRLYRHGTQCPTSRNSRRF